MKYRLLDILKDPVDGSRLTLKNPRIRKTTFKEALSCVKCQTLCAFKNCAAAEVTPRDCTSCYSQEIMEGELVSESGNNYPIKGGIPRLTSSELACWLRKNQETFSLEWKMFRFGERNWGQDIKERK